MGENIMSKLLIRYHALIVKHKRNEHTTLAGYSRRNRDENILFRQMADEEVKLDIANFLRIDTLWEYI